MHRLFPDDGAAVERTVEIAERCDLVLPEGKFHLPDFPVPAGETADSHFERMAWSGLEERLAELARRNPAALARHSIEVYRERLRYEVEVIQRMGFAGYFLIVWDFIRHAR